MNSLIDKPEENHAVIMYMYRVLLKSRTKYVIQALIFSAVFQVGRKGVRESLQHAFKLEAYSKAKHVHKHCRVVGGSTSILDHTCHRIARIQSF